MKKTKGNKKIIHQGQFIRFVQENQWEYVERHNCQGIAIILAVTQENKVLFVEQYRLPVGRKVIEFPAGLIRDNHKNESMIHAAKRELLEETGYRAVRLKEIFSGPVSGGLTSDIVTLFRAYKLKKVSSGGGDGTEFITVHEIPLEKTESWLRKMVRKGFLIEPKIYAGLYFLVKNKGKKG